MSPETIEKCGLLKVGCQVGYKAENREVRLPDNGKGRPQKITRQSRAVLGSSEITQSCRQ